MNVIYDNIIFQLQRTGGISVYWYELITRMLYNSINIYFIQRKKEASNLYQEILRNTIKSNIIYEYNIPLIIQRYIPILNSLPTDAIFHSSYYRIPLLSSKKIKRVVTVHDFIYEKRNKGIRKNIHKYQKKISLFNSDGIICISENTKNDLLEYYPEIKDKKIKVIYNGVSDDYYNIEKKNIGFDNKYNCITNGKYALFIGRRSKYKNFNFAVDVISQIKDIKLVIIGGNELSQSEIILLNSKIKNKYKHIMNINNYDLNILLNYAQFLLYPSSYEGFGIPIVEALKSGCPVVALNNSSIPEVIGCKDLMMTDLRVEEGLRVIEYIDKHREKIKKNGMEHAAKFNWDKCFNQVLSFYEEIYNY